MFRRSLLDVTVAAAALLGTHLLGSHAALAENRLALVIGQSAYRSVPVLPNPANDAKAMSQLLVDSGFEVSTASDLSQDQMRQQVGEFAGRVAAKGPDTVALVFYAGHGLQIDGENFLVPVDIDPKREADIPLQAIRLNDILNTLASVPTKMRILMLDACRNNPFPAINKSAGSGLAIVDARIGAAGTFLSFSTSPGAVAEDGSGANSPYTLALLSAAKEPGSIEDTLKRVRVSVNKATEGRQTPWDSSSLTDDFRFVAGPGGGSGTPSPASSSPASSSQANSSQASAKQAATKRSVDQWRAEFKDKPAEVANELMVADGTDEAYEAFAGLYPQTPFGLQARDWLDRHRRMKAWNEAVVLNSAAGYRAFLTKYPDSDLTATARKMEERLRNRQNVAAAIAAPIAVPLATNASLAAPTCPCNAPSPQKKIDTPAKKHVDPEPPKRVERTRPRRVIEEDVVVVRRPPPRDYYEPAPGPSIGIGGGYGRGGGYGGGGSYGSGGPIRSRGGY